jgi:hypothetical protein
LFHPSTLRRSPDPRERALSERSSRASSAAPRVRFANGTAQAGRRSAQCATTIFFESLIDVNLETNEERGFVVETIMGDAD